MAVLQFNCGIEEHKKKLCPFVTRSQQCPAAPANSVKPRSVNYHLTRQCNYQCGFCFHTAKTSFMLPIDEAQKGLRMLKMQVNCSNEYVKM